VDIFTVDRENFYQLDSILAGEDLASYDIEIENIVNGIWNGVGEHESVISPLFVTFLSGHLLRSLYINYLSLTKLINKHKTVKLDASTLVVDIIAKHLQLELSPKRKNLDVEFNLIVPHYSLRWGGANTSTLKNIVRSVRYYFSEKIAKYKGIDVIFMNAGKLKDDFYKIPNSFDCRYMPINFSSKRINWRIDDIKDVVIDNINNIDTSIPREMIVELIEESVFKYLPDILNRISTLVDFIEKNKVKLVISSGATDDVFISLLAAAKITGVRSLVVPHGVVSMHNKKLNNYCDYQGVLNNFELKYKGVEKIPFRMSWFEKKV
jgi:hypothetical protein